MCKKSSLWKSENHHQALREVTSIHAQLACDCVKRMAKKSWFVWPPPSSSDLLEDDRVSWRLRSRFRPADSGNLTQSWQKIHQCRGDTQPIKGVGVMIEINFPHYTTRLELCCRKRKSITYHYPTTDGGTFHYIQYVIQGSKGSFTRTKLSWNYIELGAKQLNFLLQTPLPLQIPCWILQAHQ